MGHHQARQHLHCEVSAGEERTDRIFEEIIAENVPTFVKDMNINIQEVQ